MGPTGSVVLGRYRLERIVGAGGAGVVWQATDEMLQQPVAVKRVPFAGHQTRLRALREATLAAKLRDHPNVVALYDVHVAEDYDVWLVLEYVPSQSLSRVVAARGRLPPGEVAGIGADVAAALSAAHERGVRHRDVTPGNVLIGTAGEVKLTDFGIAHGEAAQRITQTGLVSGTPAYMAPEVAGGEESGAAADVFGLGATMYAAVEGRPPFAGGATPDARVPEPRHAGALTPLLARALDTDPAARPSAAELGAQLRALATELSGETIDLVRYRTEPPAPVTPRPRNRRRRYATAALSGTGALLAVALLIVVLTVHPVTPGRPVAAPVADHPTSSTTKKTKNSSTTTTSSSRSRTPAPPPVGVSLVDRGRQYDNPNLYASAQYPVAYGLPDAKAGRVNQALAAPIDDELNFIRYELVATYPLSKQHEPDGSYPPVNVTSRVLSQSSTLISVAYKFRVPSELVSTGSWDRVSTATVDLRTGAALTPQQVFVPGMLNSGAIRRLLMLLDRHTEHGMCPRSSPHRIPPAQFISMDGVTATQASGRSLNVAFRPSDAEFDLDLPGLGYEVACYLQVVRVPYAELDGILDPGLLDRVAGG